MRYNFTSLTIITLFALIFVGADGGERFKYPAEDFSGDKTYRVLSVTDGDTLKIEYEGNSETIRLIGVDTPETVHPSRPVEPFGPEASAFTKNLLIGEEVYLRFGNEERGKYDRLLAYVFRSPDGLFVNLELVRQGYGHAYVKYPFEYMELFRQYESKARRFGKGLWSLPPPESVVEGEIVEGEITVYVTKSGKKYHRESCRWGNIPIILSEARERYSPCARCAPPQ